MAIYTFKNSKTGKKKEFSIPIKEYKPIMIIDGEKWERDLASDLGTAKIEDSEIWNGMESRALAVHPDQIPEVKADAKRHGVEVDFNPKNGNVIFSSRKNRREYCKLRGVVDYEGGYGDNV